MIIFKALLDSFWAVTFLVSWAISKVSLIIITNHHQVKIVKISDTHCICMHPPISLYILLHLVFLSLCLSISLSLCLSVSLSFCLSVSLLLYPSVFSLCLFVSHMSLLFFLFRRFFHHFFTQNCHQSFTLENISRNQIETSSAAHTRSFVDAYLSRHAALFGSKNEKVEMF